MSDKVTPVMQLTNDSLGLRPQMITQHSQPQQLQLAAAL